VPQRLPVAALGGSVGTPEGGLEADVVRVESLEAMEAMDLRAIEGRIVFVDQRMERARDGHGYGDTVGVRWRAAGRAAPLGALAVIIRSVGTDDTRFPHTGSMGYPEDATVRIPAAAISNADADVLGRWIAAGQTVRLRLGLGCRDAGEAQSANVIGEVVGREHPEEIVVLGAHLDSWDLGRGAVDDGAGVAIVIEAARLLLASAEPPLRTVRVVLYANEESGGAGAEAYAVAHADELSHHVLATEADFGDGEVYAVRTPLSPDVSPPWARLVGLMRELDVAYEGDDPHGGADVEDLREVASVPLLDAMQDGSRYFDLHHTANDVLTEVDETSLSQAARAFAAIASWASREPELSR
jgi:Zn-dependent M28 family amino/carboxypeptidase